MAALAEAEAIVETTEAADQNASIVIATTMTNHSKESEVATSKTEEATTNAREEDMVAEDSEATDAVMMVQEIGITEKEAEVPEVSELAAEVMATVLKTA